MHQPEPYPYEISIPIKLRILIYVEPATIDTSSFSASKTESLSTTSLSRINSSIDRDPVLGSSSSTVESNTSIQPKNVDQELIFTYSSRSVQSHGTAARTSLNMDLDRALHVLRNSDMSLCPRPILLLAAALTSAVISSAVISAVLMQVFWWPFGQTCPDLSFISLPQANLAAGFPTLRCFVPDDGNITKLSR